MGETSENIKRTFSNMLLIYEEMANLLLDADDLMGQRGYANLKGNAIESGSSRSLNYPRWWVTHSGARYYVSEDSPMDAKSVGIFFLDRKLDPIDPIIVFATMRGKATEGVPDVDPLWVLWDVWNKTIADTILDVDHAFGNIRGVASGKIRGLLLEKIQDRESLEEIVINPLITMDWK